MPLLPLYHSPPLNNSDEKKGEKKHSTEGRKAQCQSPMIPCMVIALMWKAKASLRNFNVKQKQKTFRGQWSKITSQSLASPACFLLTIPLRSLAPALLRVHVCVCMHTYRPQQAWRRWACHASHCHSILPYSTSVITGFAVSYNHALSLLMFLAQTHGVKHGGRRRRGIEWTAISADGGCRGL